MPNVVIDTATGSWDSLFLFFFFNDTATTEIYTLSLHDALPICGSWSDSSTPSSQRASSGRSALRPPAADRKSTRLNSSHVKISYAVFCLKKKKKNNNFISFQKKKKKKKKE